MSEQRNQPTDMTMTEFLDWVRTWPTELVGDRIVLRGGATAGHAPQAQADAIRRVRGMLKDGSCVTPGLLRDRTDDCEREERKMLRDG